MGRSPLCCRKTAAFIGTGCVIVIPLFSFGLAQGTPSAPSVPPAPVTPTTTTVMAPPPVSAPPTAMPSVTQSSIVTPAQPPTTQQAPILSTPVYSSTIVTQAPTSSVQTAIPVQPTQPSSTISAAPAMPTASQTQISQTPTTNQSVSTQPSILTTTEQVPSPSTTNQQTDSKYPETSQASPTLIETTKTKDSSSSPATSTMVTDGSGPPMDSNLPQPTTVDDTEHPDSSNNMPLVPLPQPSESTVFPEWGHDTPQVGTLPVVVDKHNPVPRCGEGSQECLPQPIVPQENWRNKWLDDCRPKMNVNSTESSCEPPANPDIFVVNGQHDEVVIVNNIVNQTSTNIYVTNLVTGAVYNFPYVPHDRPYAFPAGWCGGVGGSFAWSAGVQGTFSDVSFGGGGVFYTNADCGYMPHPAPAVSLIIQAPGYPQYTTNNYIQIDGCGCIFVSNTYIYGHREGSVFVPTSWTPDIVTQPAQQGLPPFLTGKNPSGNQSLPSVLMAMLTKPLFWTGIFLVVAVPVIAYYFQRRRVN